MKLFDIFLNFLYRTLYSVPDTSSENQKLYKLGIKEKGMVRLFF